MVWVHVNGTRLPMEIDSSASSTIISEETYRRVLHGQPVLNEVSTVLRTWSAKTVPVLGSITVLVTRGTRSARLQLLVAQGSGPNLLGRNWFGPLGISLVYNVQARNRQHRVNKVMSDFPEIFQDGLGKYTGPAVSLNLLPDALPKFLKSRPVPFALREKVDAEIQRLVHDGVLEPITDSNRQGINFRRNCRVYRCPIVSTQTHCAVTFQTSRLRFET
uniref:Peptidase A2 domain-containing protein n=1 Tax=Trichuris muris TaxID=70415 RepID=A0A5S6QJT3_TRIMR